MLLKNSKICSVNSFYELLLFDQILHNAKFLNNETSNKLTIKDNIKLSKLNKFSAEKDIKLILFTSSNNDEEICVPESL